MTRPSSSEKQEWTADDEVEMIIVLVETGFDNWSQVASEMTVKRSASEIEQHFFDVYSSGPLEYRERRAMGNISVLDAHWAIRKKGADYYILHNRQMHPQLHSWRMDNLTGVARNTCLNHKSETILALAVCIRAKLKDKPLNFMIPVWYSPDINRKHKGEITCVLHSGWFLPSYSGIKGYMTLDFPPRLLAEKQSTVWVGNALNKR